MIKRINGAYTFWIGFNAFFCCFDLFVALTYLLRVQQSLWNVLGAAFFVALSCMMWRCMRSNVRWRREAQERRRRQAEQAAVMQHAYGEWL